jgi:hypothetical protein
MSNGGYDPEFGPFRFSHIERIYGENNEGVTLTFDDGTEIKGADCRQCWIDTAVYDQIVTVSGDGRAYQRTVWRFLYTEQNDETGELNNTVRMGYWKRVHCPLDKSLWIDVPVTFRVLLEWSSGYRWQRMLWQFDNTLQNNIRNTLKRRVFHYNIDDNYLTNRPDSENPDKRARPPRNPKDYIQAIVGSGSKMKKSLFLDVEVVMRWATIGEQRDTRWDNQEIYTQGQGTYYVPGHSGDPLMRVPLVPDPNA